MLSINKSIAQSTQKTPFEMVYGQATQHDDVFWRELLKQASENLNDPHAPIDEETLSQIFEYDDKNHAKSVSYLHLHLLFIWQYTRAPMEVIHRSTNHRWTICCQEEVLRTSSRSKN